MIPLLVDQDNLPLAYLSKNAILQLQTGQVLGVVLGRCVFSKAGMAVGKLFHGILRNEKGEQVAVLTLKEEPAETTLPAVPRSEKIWELIQSIKDHACLNIPETAKWSSRPLEDLLLITDKR
jgi:hypothetical protein